MVVTALELRGEKESSIPDLLSGWKLQCFIMSGTKVGSLSLCVIVFLLSRVCSSYRFCRLVGYGFFSCCSWFGVGGCP